MVAVLCDPNLGPVLMVGAGGTTAELLVDVRLLVPPLDAQHVREEIASLATAPLLAGYRGAPARAVGALVDLVLALAASPAVVSGQVSELDLIPVLVFPPGHGVGVVDVAMRLEQAS
jgi:acetate---CoA ligase (ADP-forming)